MLKGSLGVGELSAVPDTTRWKSLPPEALEQLEMLNVKDADLRDVLRTIAESHNLNLVVDNRIAQRVTIRLADLPVIEAVEFLCSQYNLLLQQSGHIFHVSIPPQPPQPPPPGPKVTYADGLLSVDLRNDDLDDVIRSITQQSGKNILVRRGVAGDLYGTLQGVPLDQGLKTLLTSNGFSVREKEGIYHIDRLGFEEEGGQQGARSFWVQATDSLIALEVVNARIADVLREVSLQTKTSFITYDAPEERITAKAEGVTLDELLNLLLKRTNITYRKQGSLYFIGDKTTKGLTSTRLLRLNHIRADAVLELLPDAMSSNATIVVVKEHNGLMITGTHDVITELEAFLQEVDYPTPQLLIEALVVDFEANDMIELGLTFGRDQATATTASQTGIRFNGETTTGENAGLVIKRDGRQINEVVNSVTKPISNLFGLGQIGRLPDNFFAHIQALALEGRANIRSRPQIATLNGYPASLLIGTTQYYLLQTQTPYQNPGSVLLQNSQRFEKITADVKLEITPWVSASGEITVEIRPEFSNPVGDFDPDIPPTISTRVFESTVRLQDGETIILGGMIQDEDRKVYNKVPLLGDLPLLGRLFRSTFSEVSKKELVIFLTPHVFYGDHRDGERWNRLKESMQLEGTKTPGLIDKILGQ